jgi:NitT/TauT family transport system substrate-binding protein
MRRLGRIRDSTVGALLMAAVVSGCTPRGADPALRDVRIALSRDGITWLPIYIAQSLGYYREEGLSISISDVAGLSKGMEALLGGSVDVAASTPTLAVQVAAEGRPVQTFLSFSARPSIALVVAPAARAAIHSVSDLEGRRVGVSSPGSPTHLMVNYALVTNGVSPAQVSTISIAAGAASIAALEHRQVDAAALVGSAITVMEQRYPDLRILVDMRTAEGVEKAFGSATFPSATLDATEEWLKDNNEAARRFVRATLKGMRWMRSHSPEEARTHIPEALRTTDASGDVAAIRLAQRNLSPDGAMPADGFDLARRVVAAANEKVRARPLDLTKLFTNEFVRQP